MPADRQAGRQTDRQTDRQTSDIVFRGVFFLSVIFATFLLALLQGENVLDRYLNVVVLSWQLFMNAV